MDEQAFGGPAALTRESATAIVRRQLEEDGRDGQAGASSAADLEWVAAAAVDALWSESWVKLFLPVLALQDAHADLRAQSAAGSDDRDGDALLEALAMRLTGVEELHLLRRAEGDWRAGVVRHQAADARQLVRTAADGAGGDGDGADPGRPPRLSGPAPRGATGRSH